MPIDLGAINSVLLQATQSLRDSGASSVSQVGQDLVANNGRRLTQVGNGYRDLHTGQQFSPFAGGSLSSGGGRLQPFSGGYLNPGSGERTFHFANGLMNGAGQRMYNVGNDLKMNMGSSLGSKV